MVGRDIFHRLLFGLEVAEFTAFLDWRLRSISKSEYVKRSTKTLSLACKAVHSTAGAIRLQSNEHLSQGGC